MKETISKVKRQPSEWEKIITNEATDKELILKIYKQFMQLNSRKIKDQSYLLMTQYICLLLRAWRGPNALRKKGD